MGASHGDFIKYPRTPHLIGSSGTSDDMHLDARQSARLLASESLVVEEKLDGTNVAIHFSGDEQLVLQCRGHLITEGMHPQYDLFKQWAAAKQHLFAQVLQRRYILFGEWLHAKHNIHYLKLPHFFIAIDVFDKDNKTFLSRDGRANLIDELAVPTPPVLHSGPIAIGQLERLLTDSHFAGQFEHPRSNRIDRIMEGLYFRVETAGVVAARAKFVRPEFTLRARENSAWRHQEMSPNELIEDADIWR